MERPDVIIPVYRPDKKLERLITMLLSQTIHPRKVVLMVTECEEVTAEDVSKMVSRATVAAGVYSTDRVEFELVRVKKENYDHGGTRNLAVTLHSNADFFLCMTQDAIPADIFLVEKLLRCFEDENVGAAYARQTASENASFTERYLRLHNYPEESVVKTKADLERLGIRTYMISNACAMYRRSLYDRLGGFVTDALFNEDMIYGAAVIESGAAIVYQSEARVLHTHNYGLKAQLCRSFDMAVPQKDNPQVFESVSSEREGFRYYRGGMNYCFSQKRYADAFLFTTDAIARYLGFFLGKHYKKLPKSWVLSLTLQPAYWEKRAHRFAKNENLSKEPSKEDEDIVESNPSLDLLHSLEKEALKRFLAFCDAYDLRYYAIGGTLLGAVRHGGFIPWDDDVDLGMPRKDYDRMLELVMSGEADSFMGEDFRIDCYRNNTEFKSYFAKIASTKYEICEELLEEDKMRPGYLVDLLPIDGTPDSLASRSLYYAKAMFYRFLCGTANVSTGIRTSRPKWEQSVLKTVRAMGLYKLIDVRKVYEKMDKLFHRMDSENAEFTGTLTGAYKTKEIVPRIYWGDTYEEYSCFDFDGLKLRAPKAFDSYLTHMYGDYEKLPPKSQRKVHYQPTIRKKDEL